MSKKFNLAERFKKNEMTIDKETADKSMDDNEIVREEINIEKTTKIGVVVGCDKLNLRMEPSTNSSIICTLTNAQEVEVDTAFNNQDFYRVITVLGASGYCMKKYITIKE